MTKGKGKKYGKKNLSNSRCCSTYFWLTAPHIVRAKTTEKAMVNVSTTLNLREEPNTEAKILATMFAGEMVKTYGNLNEEWCEIETQSGKKGYVKSSYLLKVEEGTIKIKEFDGEAELLNTVVVTKDHSSADRNYNMSLACKKIDGLILEPGEIFNWYGQNGVGPASKENGYKKTTVLIGGKGAPGYGGGVCQVATALYNCIYGIGMDADVHYVHSEKQPYVKPGMVEATVAYGQKNFVFHNQKDYSIMFKAYAESCGANNEGGRVIMSVYKVSTE